MGKLTLLVMVAALCAVPCHAGEAVNLDEEQWLFRANVGATKHPPFAVFLSWDFSSVLFRAHCERGNMLVVEYFGDGTSLKGGAIAIGPDAPAGVGDMTAKSFQLRTALKANGTQHILEGRITVSAEFAKFITSADQVAIDAPNEMGEVWHTGSARPFKKIVRDCH